MPTLFKRSARYLALAIACGCALTAQAAYNYRVPISGVGLLPPPPPSATFTLDSVYMWGYTTDILVNGPAGAPYSVQAGLVTFTSTPCAIYNDCRFFITDITVPNNTNYPVSYSQVFGNTAYSQATLSPGVYNVVIAASSSGINSSHPLTVLPGPGYVPRACSLDGNTVTSGETLNRYLTPTVGYPANCSDLSAKITCTDGRISTDLRLNAIPTTYASCDQSSAGQPAIAFSKNALVYSQTLPTTFILHSTSASPSTAQLAAGVITVEIPACYSSTCGFNVRRADHTFVGEVVNYNVPLGTSWTGNITLPAGAYEIYSVNGSYSGTWMGNFSTY